MPENPAVILRPGMKRFELPMSDAPDYMKEYAPAREVRSCIEHVSTETQLEACHDYQSPFLLVWSDQASTQWHALRYAELKMKLQM